MTHSTSNSKAFDTAIIGAGIMGLWAARHAIKRGERVVVVEKRHVGAGASGGFLGALMPHMPDNWNAKKQYQYEGLTTIDAAIAELEADTGMDCGFRRCGRIVPLSHEKMVAHVTKRIAGANINWDRDYTLQLIDKNDIKTWLAGQDWPSDWINPDIAPFGLQHDTLAARVDPRAYLRALEAYVRSRAEILENTEAIGLDITSPTPLSSIEVRPAGSTQGSGRIIPASRIIVANGWEAYPLLQPLMGEMNQGKPIGRGVKGQAVLLDFDHPDSTPIVYHDGVYVVPQSGNRVAVGSTSVNNWQHAINPEPDEFDPGDTEFLSIAQKYVPVLQNSRILEQWAGVRPRNTLVGGGTGPYFSKIGDCDNGFALIGGFKITFGIAHLPFSDFSTKRYGFFT